MKKQHTIEVNKDTCVGCGLCKIDCPTNNIYIKDKKSVIKGQDCIMCGHCVAICPSESIIMTGFDEPPIEYSKQPTLDADELLMAIKSRRTIRKFKNKEVPQEVIQQIIEAGRFTPTAKNSQDVSYIVLNKDKRKYEEVAVKIFRKIKPIVGLWMKGARKVAIDDDFFFKKAPLVIMVTTKDKVSGSFAASNMALMAESYGLGVLYSGFFTEVANKSPKLKKLLNLKSKGNIVATLVLGYPDVKYRRTAQKETTDVSYL